MSRNNGDEDKQLRKACRQMEGAFLGMLMKSMRQTVSKTDLFGSERNEGMFRDMLDTEICDRATETQSLGLADLLYRQLSPRLDDDKPQTNERRGSEP